MKEQIGTFPTEFYEDARCRLQALYAALGVRDSPISVDQSYEDKIGARQQRDALQAINGLKERVLFTERFETLQLRLIRLRDGCARDNDEICQTLGQVLDFPWFKDDQVNFPGATKEHGVCVGDHVAATMATIAARRIEQLRAEVDVLRGVGCCEGGDGPCGVCIKCYQARCVALANEIADLKALQDEMRNFVVNMDLLT